MCISSNNMLSASSYRQRANEREREWYYPQNLMLVVRVLFFFASYLVVVSIEYCLFDETEIRAFAAVLVFSLSPPLRRLGLGFIHVYIYPAVINYSIIIISFFSLEVKRERERKVYDIIRTFELLSNDFLRSPERFSIYVFLFLIVVER